MTRICQPGWLAPLPLRYASTSAGVRLSLPGHSGQVPLDEGRGTVSRLKSLGLRARSAEMITQRPVTGSLLSSGKTQVYLYCLDRKSTRLNSSHLGISYAV